MSDQSTAKVPEGCAIRNTRPEGPDIEDCDEGPEPEGQRQGKPESLRHKPPAAPLLAQSACALRSRCGSAERSQPSRRFFRDNGLTIVLVLLFLFSLLGMVFSGLSQANETLLRHHQAPLGLLAFLGSGAFLSALFENWESEFLQMGVYVVLTAMLFQRGSAESKDPDEENEPSARSDSRIPSASSFFYAHSLGIALFVLFALSFVLHVTASFQASREEALWHGDTLASFWGYLLDSSLWFESFQNWQSEFLSTATLVVLSIYLREKGSPESKPVEAPDAQTGD